MIDSKQTSVKSLDQLPRRFTRARAWLAALVMVFLLGAPAMPASAEEYNPPNAGQPLRVAAYVLHPVGVIFNFLVLQPAYWVGAHEPFRTFFGRQD